MQWEHMDWPKNTKTKGIYKVQPRREILKTCQNWDGGSEGAKDNTFFGTLPIVIFCCFGRWNKQSILLIVRCNPQACKVLHSAHRAQAQIQNKYTLQNYTSVSLVWEFFYKVVLIHRYQSMANFGISLSIKLQEKLKILV